MQKFGSHTGTHIWCCGSTIWLTGDLKLSGSIKSGLGRLTGLQQLRVRVRNLNILMPIIWWYHRTLIYWQALSWFIWKWWQDKSYRYGPSMNLSLSLSVSLFLSFPLSHLPTDLSSIYVCVFVCVFYIVEGYATKNNSENKILSQYSYIFL